MYRFLLMCVFYHSLKTRATVNISPQDGVTRMRDQQICEALHSVHLNTVEIGSGL